MRDTIFENLNLASARNPYDFDSRSVPSFSDELVIRKAKIHIL
jgi:hypothetical protein